MKGADRFTLESRKRSLVRSSSSFISGYCLIFYILINLLSRSSAFSTNVFGCRPHVTALLAKHPDIEIDKTKARLLADFRTDDGEYINPYEVLRVRRTANHTEIKNSYRTLMKKLHPDKQQFNNGILPGSCNNIDDVKKEFQRVKHAYEILSDKKMRVRYDRNSAIADPGAAVTRAATDATLNAFGAVFSGLRFAGEGIVKIAIGDEKND